MADRLPACCLHPARFLPAPSLNSDCNTPACCLHPPYASLPPGCTQPACCLHPTCTLTAFACIPLALPECCLHPTCLHLASTLLALSSPCLHSTYTLLTPKLHAACTLPAPRSHPACVLPAPRSHVARTLPAPRLHSACTLLVFARPAPRSPPRSSPVPVLPPAGPSVLYSRRSQLSAPPHGRGCRGNVGGCGAGGHRGAGTGSERAALRHRAVIVGRAGLEVGVVEVMMMMGVES